MEIFPPLFYAFVFVPQFGNDDLRHASLRLSVSPVCQAGQVVYLGVRTS